MKGLAFAFIYFLAALLVISIVFLIFSNVVMSQLIPAVETLPDISGNSDAQGVLNLLKNTWAYGWVMVLIVALLLYLLLRTQTREYDWGYGGYA